MKKMNRKGFTIVELVIVIAVIAILAAVLIPTFSGVVERANESAAVQTVRGALSNVLAANTDQGKLNGGEFVIYSGNATYQYTYYNGQLITTETGTQKVGKENLGNNLELEVVDATYKSATGTAQAGTKYYSENDGVYTEATGITAGDSVVGYYVLDVAKHIECDYSKIIVTGLTENNDINEKTKTAILNALNAKIGDNAKKINNAAFSYDGEDKILTITYDTLTYEFNVYVNTDLATGLVAFVR